MGKVCSFHIDIQIGLYIMREVPQQRSGMMNDSICICRQRNVCDVNESIKAIRWIWHERFFSARCDVLVHLKMKRCCLESYGWFSIVLVRKYTFGQSHWLFETRRPWSEYANITNFMDYRHPYHVLVWTYNAFYSYPTKSYFFADQITEQIHYEWEFKFRMSATQ